MSKGTGEKKSEKDRGVDREGDGDRDKLMEGLEREMHEWWEGWLRKTTTALCLQRISIVWKRPRILYGALKYAETSSSLSTLCPSDRSHGPLLYLVPGASFHRNFNTHSENRLI